MKCTMSVSIPILSGLVLTILFVFPVIGFSELTEKDLEKIRQIVQSEVNTIKQDITEVELRLIEKIRESENRLQSQFNVALDNRTNDIMIIFAVVSMGFFLLFGCILLVGALRNRQPNKKLIILMMISLAGALLCRVPPINAQPDRFFGDIVCTRLTVLNRNQREVVSIFPYGDDGGSIQIHGKPGQRAVMRTDGYGGQVLLRGKHGDVSIYTDGQGGRLNISSSKSGKATMLINEYGGSISLSQTSKISREQGILDGINEPGDLRLVDPRGHERMFIGVDEDGNGVIAKWDKNGYRLK